MSDPQHEATVASPVVPAAAGDADAVAAAVVACPSVAELSGGRFGEVATYLPGRRVTGVRVRDDALDVHVVGLFGTPIAMLDREVRAAVAPYAHGRAVNIRVDDLRTPEELPRALPPGE